MDNFQLFAKKGPFSGLLNLRQPWPGEMGREFLMRYSSPQGKGGAKCQGAAVLFLRSQIKELGMGLIDEQIFWWTFTCLFCSNPKVPVGGVFLLCFLSNKIQKIIPGFSPFSNESAFTLSGIEGELFLHGQYFPCPYQGLTPCLWDSANICGYQRAPGRNGRNEGYLDTSCTSARLGLRDGQ